MKTKLLSLLLFVLIANAVRSQTSTTDYVSGVVDATYLTMNGTDMYVLGSTDIYKIDTTVSNPTPTSIYTSESDFFLVNFTINGNLLYVVLENYAVATDTFLGGKIIALDLSNLSNPEQNIYTTEEYISSITNNGATIYITAETPTNPPSFDPFITHLDEIDASNSTPTAQAIVSNLTNDSVVRGSVFENNTIYVSSSSDGEILTIDVSQSNPTVNVLYSNTIFPRGIFMSSNDLYISDGSSIDKLDITNPSEGSTAIAINDTYTNNGSSSYENFSDVVLVGNTVYATLQNQGRVVQAVDMTLATNKFTTEPSNVSIYNNKNQVIVYGLTNEKHNVKIYSLTGSEILGKNMNSNDNTIDIDQLSNGIYLLNIDQKQSFKFIK